ncbi:hypothetical protein EV421DRAFT_1442171 [Armillaria borealis]|uniref:Uncharacterized protein n=1 Tax=Armillaria borealis TaxID=47425 RepID=A0AA39MGW8_9AGAR|nr:hypothetical protein EV421DRAFT_1442171 [Armillaria borealis]
MWLQGLDDKDDVEHRALFYHQVGCSCPSFQFIVRPLFPGLPCFTKPFLPCPVLVSCVCVSLCSRASWFLCLRSGCVLVHRCSCVCVTVVFLFRCVVSRPCIVLAFPSHSWSWARVPCLIPWGPCVMSHSCVWSCLVACHLPWRACLPFPLCHL